MDAPGAISKSCKADVQSMMGRKVFLVNQIDTPTSDLTRKGLLGPEDKTDCMSYGEVSRSQ